MDNATFPVSRRRFLAGAAATLASNRFYRPLHARQPSEKTLRVIAYNVYECTGWPKDRPLGKKATVLGQMPARFAQQLALYDADVITLSESPAESVVQAIAEHLGMKLIRFPSGGNWPGTLMTRLEILDSDNAPLVRGPRPPDLFTRHWGRATLRLPTGEPLVVHSAHLHPAPEPEVRMREITEMLEAMQPDLAAGRPMILMGDLNHRPAPPEYPRWLQAGWVDTFAQVGKGEGLTFTSADLTLEKRIDYVLAAGPLSNSILDARPLDEGAFRVNPADPQDFALSDHLPQLADFRIAH